MGTQLTEKSTVALIHTLKTQNMQGEALVALLTEVGEIKTQMEESAKEVKSHVDESKAILVQVTEQVTINYDEQREIKSLVGSISNRLTKEHLSQVSASSSDNLFKSWKGLFTCRIHSKLKQRMNVVRYTSIKRIDYKEATEFLNALAYINFSKKDLEPTPSILTVLALEKEE